MEDSHVEEITKVKRVRKIQEPLQKYFKPEKNVFEIGVDEAGRGPLFGRVYSAAVILPKDDSFDHSKVKDSKKFTSKKKIEEVAEYIKNNALAWHVSFEDEASIDNINILQATQKSMHTSILGVKNKYIQIQKQNQQTEENTDIQDNCFHLLIDGNYFNPITYVNKKTNKLETMTFDMIEGGDNKYTSIAAASILAKVERDKYIEDLCELHPYLSENYGINTNKGYGAKKHIEGIKEHGITMWHRKTFGICKKYV
jgi:ribonuclease HII